MSWQIARYRKNLDEIAAPPQVAQRRSAVSTLFGTWRHLKKLTLV
jgi:hypothetical protein